MGGGIWRRWKRRFLWGEEVSADGAGILQGWRVTVMTPLMAGCPWSAVALPGRAAVMHQMASCEPPTSRGDGGLRMRQDRREPGQQPPCRGLSSASPVSHGPSPLHSMHPPPSLLHPTPPPWSSTGPPSLGTPLSSRRKGLWGTGGGRGGVNQVWSSH